MYIAEQTAKRIAVYNLETKSLEEPLLLPTINAGIRDYLARHDYTSVGDLCGSLVLNG